jgi:hypothetical protein
VIVPAVNPKNLRITAFKVYSERCVFRDIKKFNRRAFIQVVLTKRQTRNVRYTFEYIAVAGEIMHRR